MCDEDTPGPLHLRIQAWHESNKEPGYPLMEDFKSILIPRQHLLKTLEHRRPADELRAILREMKDKNEDLVIDDKHGDGMDVIEALDVYKTFHHLTRATDWGKVPWPCSCPTSHAHCACQHGTMFTSLSSIRKCHGLCQRNM
jgi:hypothetical protein